MLNVNLMYYPHRAQLGCIIHLLLFGGVCPGYKSILCCDGYYNLFIYNSKMSDIYKFEWWLQKTQIIYDNKRKVCYVELCLEQGIACSFQSTYHTQYQRRVKKLFNFIKNE